MKRYIKAICLICCLSLVLTVCSACGNKNDTETAEKKEYLTGTAENVASSDAVAENDRWRLGYDAETANVTITDKASGYVYSQVPYEHYLANRDSFKIAENSFQPDVEVPTADEATQSMQMFSPINISVLNSVDNSTSYFYANPEVFVRGRVGSEMIENGIRVTYYYDACQIAVPVEYTIDDDSFNVQVIPTNIIEGTEDNDILTVGLSPMFCSAKNDSDSYVVVPSGSGAVMYTDVRANNVARNYSGEVYGDDPTVEMYEKLSNIEEARLPMFGVVEGNRAVCAIIESGKEKCTINAQTGDPITGYSCAYITCQVRGYNRPIAIVLAERVRIRTHIKNELTFKEPIRVSYYAMSGNDANYTGIAECYRDYLISQKGMSTEAENSLLYTQILGGFQSDELFLGLPYKKTRSLTSYKEATEMVKQLSEVASGDMVVDMIGFGNTGVAAGEIGGGFDLTGVNGNKKALNGFLSAASELGARTFFDFDIVRFTKSANGFGETAVTANNASSKQYRYNLSTKLREMDDFYYLLQRSQLQKAADKTSDTADKYGITGIGLESLGSIAYSDYYEEQYYNKGNMDSQVTEIIASLKKDGKTVVVNKANDYAAVAADLILDVPTKSNMSSSLDKDIPLYQIVFKGYVEFANESINTAQNMTTQYLKAIECGSGLSFTLSANYSEDTIYSNEAVFYATLFEDNKDLIQSLISSSSAYLNAVKSAKITSHSTVAADVSKTVFDNGVYVYVNFGKNAVTTADGVSVPAESFAAFTEGGTLIG